VCCYRCVWCAAYSQLTTALQQIHPTCLTRPDTSMHAPIQAERVAAALAADSARREREAASAQAAAARANNHQQRVSEIAAASAARKAAAAREEAERAALQRIDEAKQRQLDEDAIAEKRRVAVQVVCGRLVLRVVPSGVTEGGPEARWSLWGVPTSKAKVSSSTHLPFCSQRTSLCQPTSS
jgi:hypothetical protein